MVFSLPQFMVLTCVVILHLIAGTVAPDLLQLSAGILAPACLHIKILSPLGNVSFLKLSPDVDIAELRLAVS